MCLIESRDSQPAIVQSYNARNRCLWLGLIQLCCHCWLSSQSWPCKKWWGHPPIPSCVHTQHMTKVERGLKNWRGKSSALDSMLRLDGEYMLKSWTLLHFTRCVSDHTWPACECVLAPTTVSNHSDKFSFRLHQYRGVTDTSTIKLSFFIVLFKDIKMRV